MADGGHEFLEIERFEVRSIFEPFFIPGLECGFEHRGGFGAFLNECGVGGLDDFRAFCGAVADEEDRACRQQVFEAVGSYN